MKYIVALLIVALSAPAFAGETRSSSPASTTQHQGQQQAQQQTQTQRAVSRSRASVVNNVSAPGTSGGSGIGGRTPDVYAPPLGGSNNCAVGLTLGGAGLNGGGALGFLWEDSDCRRREHARMLHGLRLDDAATEALCGRDETRRALYSTGHPCARDRNGWDNK